MGVLKPLQGEPLTFWCSGGSIIWRGDGRTAPISRTTAEGLRAVFEREAGKASAKMWLQITAALDAQDDWRALFNPQARKAA